MEIPERSTGSEYADHIRAVLERAASIESAEGQMVVARRPVVTHPAVIAGMGVALAAVVLYNAANWAPPPSPVPRPAAEASVQIALVVATQAIDAFEREHGRLPASLEEAGVPGAPYTYRVAGGAYELFATEGDVSKRVDERTDGEGLVETLGHLVGGSIPR